MTMFGSRNIRLGLVFGMLFVLILQAVVYAVSVKPKDDYKGHLWLNKPMAGAPNTQNCSHRVGNVFFTITNWGYFGSGFGDAYGDWLTEDFCLNPGVVRGLHAPSFEFPAGTGINYLYQGALWIGAIVDEDTLVSFGSDGWQRSNEMYPASLPDGGIIQLSNRKSSPYYSNEAVSEQDYIAEYTDTLTDPNFTDADWLDNRPHVPLFVKIIQRSYSWSYSYAEDFVLIDYKIVNIGVSEIRKAYMALYVDADIWDAIEPERGFADDMTGFKQTFPSPACDQLIDSINIGWTADFNGYPTNGTFTSHSPTGVAGTRVVRSPNPELHYSFNWWVSNGDNTDLDWGPRRQENSRDFGTGGLGTPEGDRNKYYVMSRSEFDYDQLWSDVDFSDQGWLPPNPTLGKDLADGFDTRYLFSFGPFDIQPGDTLPFTIAYIAGDKFHSDPTAARIFNSKSPGPYYDQLDFYDFAINAVWAGKVYDNPGVDTDGDHYAGVKVANPCKTGDSLYISGDSIPDFSGPPPPPPPILSFAASPGKITIRWNGKDSETTADPFSFSRDFEGYRIYIADDLQLSRFSLLSSCDNEDYNRYRENRKYTPSRWELRDIPFTLDSLKRIYSSVPDFHPDSFPSPLKPLQWTEEDNGEIVQTAYYFRPVDYNREDWNKPGAIRQPNREELSPTDSIWDDAQGKYVWHYFDYDYTIEGLLPSKPVYLAVTTIDFGDPGTNLPGLESSPLVNAIQVYPIWSADEVTVQKLDVAVFPNPYKVNAGYFEAGYEEITPDAPSEERSRRIHFANLPKKATIRIYTLDGDLVRELQHPDRILSEGESMIAWDLISRNTQAVASGIYLYSVESELGNQVGKFVIIK